MQVAGRCIGATDVIVDRRKSKRLAHRIRSWARRHGAPRVVITSPLRRTSDVGRRLASWGWVHRVDARLSELDFGTWDGRGWDEIGRVAVDGWIADFAVHRPGGGESVGDLMNRCASFVAESSPACVVTHAGWISAAMWLEISPTAPPSSRQWPSAVRYGQLVAF